MAAPGELFAKALATAETHAFAIPAGMPGSATVLLLGLVLAWVLASRGKLLVAPLVIGFLAAYLIICLVVFETDRVALPLTPMAGLAVFLALFRLLAPREKRKPANAAPG